MLLAALEYYPEIVLVQIGIVTIDFDHLGNKAPAWSSFELHDDAKRISRIGLDGSSAFFHERCVAIDSTVNFEPLPFA